LKDIIRKPAFFAVCLYGIAFVLLGNIATNSMAFGVRVLQAAGRSDPNNAWEARGIALAVVTFTCLLHSLWRVGGIWLSNIFAVVKISILLAVFVTGCLTWGGIFHRSGEAIPNMAAPDAFKNPSQDAYAFAEAYLSIVFAYGGFNQANYVSINLETPYLMLIILDFRGSEGSEKAL
jgi:amino acid transporter